MSKQQHQPNDYLFSAAVVLMAAVSCFTTAKGIEPMLNNTILSWAVALALSIFMMAIALQFPRAYREGRQRQMIMRYSAVALFSVLLNFNAIYGSFTQEKLLYDEVNEKRNLVEQIATSAEDQINNKYGLTNTRRAYEEAKVAYENEVSNPGRSGHGKIAQGLYEEMTLAEGKLQATEEELESTLTIVETEKNRSLQAIDSALAAEDPALYRNAIDVAIKGYNEIGSVVSTKLGEDSFQYEKIDFVHRDSGNLNHSLWTISQLFNMEGRQATAVLVSLLLSILIDFIVLFVLVLTHAEPKTQQHKGMQYTYSRPIKRTRRNRPGPVSFKHTHTSLDQQGKKKIIEDRPSPKGAVQDI